MQMQKRTGMAGVQVMLQLPHVVSLREALLPLLPSCTNFEALYCLGLMEKFSLLLL